MYPVYRYNCSIRFVSHPDRQGASYNQRSENRCGKQQAARKGIGPTPPPRGQSMLDTFHTDHLHDQALESRAGRGWFDGITSNRARLRLGCHIRFDLASQTLQLPVRIGIQSDRAYIMVSKILQCRLLAAGIRSPGRSPSPACPWRTPSSGDGRERTCRTFRT